MMDEQVVKVLLVDDHVVVRKGLIFVLDAAPRIDVIGEAASGEEAVYLNKVLKPDIILMDIKMDGMDGLETTQLIMRHDEKAKIIGLSTFIDASVITQMIKAGARAFLEKNVSGVELAEVIHRVMKGERVFPIQRSNTVSSHNSSSDREKPLGDQQKKVLVLMIKGFTNHEIADQLGFSVSTARYHVSAILRKLDVSTRSEAVAHAVKFSLVSVDDL